MYGVLFSRKEGFTGYLNWKTLNIASNKLSVSEEKNHKIKPKGDPVCSLQYSSQGSLHQGGYMSKDLEEMKEQIQGILVRGKSKCKNHEVA